jgi:hypothetical protein
LEGPTLFLLGLLLAQSRLGSAAVVARRGKDASALFSSTQLAAGAGARFARAVCFDAAARDLPTLAAHVTAPSPTATRDFRRSQPT